MISATVEAQPFGVLYRIECDAGWRVRATHARVIGADVAIDLTSEGAGRWQDATGLRPDLEGAIDVDLSVTPFTNTLPIRRLDLTEGQRAEVRVVYVSFPDLNVTIDRQRYTCMNRGRYRYESLDSEFTRDIDVDANGLIVTYPGLFRRIL